MDSLVDSRRPVSATPSHLLDPAQILRTLRKNAWVIGLCAIAGGAAAYALSASQPKSYTAYAAVAVEGEQIAIPELQGALQQDNSPDPMPAVHTEMQALDSRQLLQQVIEQLHLDRDPEFNGSLRKPSFFDQIKDRVKSLIPHHAEPGSDGNSQDDALVGAVNRALAITQDNRSLVIGLSFTAHDPKLAANFLNTLVQDYIDTRVKRRSEADVGANSVIMERIDKVQQEIDQIDRKMRDLRTESGFVGLHGGSLGQQQVENLADALSKATVERSEIEAQYDRAVSLASSGSADALASVLGSETISRLREEEATASSKVADLAQRYGPNWPALRSAQADLSAVRRQIAAEGSRIVASLATQLRVARAHEADVSAQLNQARGAGISAQNVQAQLDQLQQDATTRRQLYQSLLEQSQRTATQPHSDHLPDVRVLSSAVPPGLPSAPNMKAAAMLGTLGGGMLSAAFCLAFTSRKGGVLDATVLSRVPGLTLLGTLRGKLGLSGGGKSGLAARIRDNPTGEEAATMRMARARLGQVARTPPRKVAFAGAQSGPAASGVAAGFARTAALDGQRVLLVDAAGGAADLARSLEARPGQLDAVLSGIVDWRDAVTQDSVPGLSVLIGQSATSSFAHSPVALENLLAEAREDYDLVILGAPSSSNPDALSLARSADVTVVVVDGRGSAEPGLAACNRLAPMSRSPLAAILLMPA